GAMRSGPCWTLLTWYVGFPSSSRHALVGGLLGAALASAHNHWAVVKWSVAKIDPKTAHTVLDGLYPKVVQPMIFSPIIGFLGGRFVMWALLVFICHFCVC